MPTRCERCSIATPGPSRCSAPAPYTAHALPQRANAGVRTGRGRCARLSHGVTACRSSCDRKPGAPLVNAGVYIVGGVSRKSAGTGGHSRRLMVRTSLKGTRRAARCRSPRRARCSVEALDRHRGTRELRLVDLRSGAICCRRDRTARRRRAASTSNEDALETERAIAIADVVAMRDDMYRYPMRLAKQRRVRRASVRNSGERHARRRWLASTATQSRVASRARADVGGGDRPRRRRRSRRAGAHGRAAHFGELRYEEPRQVSPPDWPRVLTTNVEPRDRAQTALTVLFPGPSRGDERDGIRRR